MKRLGFVLAIGASLIFAEACASSTEQSERHLVFQTVEGSRPAVRIFSDDSVIVKLESEELVFPNATRTFPRWNGVRFQARSDGRQLYLDVRSDRPCVVEGVPRARTATVMFRLDGMADQQTACGFFSESPSGDE